MTATLQDTKRQWLVCQLGAREHYVIPGGLHRAGRLLAMITDVWVPPGGSLAKVSRRLADRYSPGLADARIHHATHSALALEMVQRLCGRSPSSWQTIMQRNAWFERRAVSQIRAHRLLEAPVKPVVFAYSYAALEILRVARAAGCQTVLGQIDPAVSEEKVVAQAVADRAQLQPRWQSAPGEYWSRWRLECQLADRIVVNSEWSRNGLTEVGIPEEKLDVVPLAYQQKHEVLEERAYPAKFDENRRLRVLFLGSLIVRKGIAETLEAARILEHEPVEFHFVGSEGIAFPADALANLRIVRHGPATRSEVPDHYARADVFILPSLSDGFGLTQVEAQASALPVIASRHCGSVVRDGVDGVLIDRVSGPEIARALRQYLRDPVVLAAHSKAAATGPDRFSPENVINRLLALVPGT